MNDTVPLNMIEIRERVEQFISGKRDEELFDITLNTIACAIDVPAHDLSAAIKGVEAYAQYASRWYAKSFKEVFTHLAAGTVYSDGVPDTRAREDNERMELVMQQHEHGCGAAVFAMLTGLTYREAINELPLLHWDREGITHITLDHGLANRGFAVARKHRHSFGNLPLCPWPCAPFADVHVVQVIVTSTSRAGHLVIWRRDGVVLDPGLGRHAQGLAVYHEVHWIAGVTRLGFFAGGTPNPTDG